MAAVSVSIGEPGFFGRIDLGGGAPPPEVINTQAGDHRASLVYGQRAADLPARTARPRARLWAAIAPAYNACGQPVYFVRDDWYTNVYARHYREHGDIARNEYLPRPRPRSPRLGP